MDFKLPRCVFAPLDRNFFQGSGQFLSGLLLDTAQTVAQPDLKLLKEGARFVIERLRAPGDLRCQPLLRLVSAGFEAAAHLLTDDTQLALALVCRKLYG